MEAVLRWLLLYTFYDIEAVKDFSKDNILIVAPRCVCGGDEKLSDRMSAGR
jgi:hypothetical protein